MKVLVEYAPNKYRVEDRVDPEERAKAAEAKLAEVEAERDRLLEENQTAWNTVALNEERGRKTIEALTAALRAIAYWPSDGSGMRPDDVRELARAALKETETDDE